MSKYRKKPVIIDAVKYSGDNVKEIFDFTEKDKKGGIRFNIHNNTIGILTMEGEMCASIGDFIIKGVQGEFYPCKPDIFEATYTKV